MIDVDGYRTNVGMVIIRDDGRVFWARRIRHDGWQFPQGGMNTDETPREAMYRELAEETGLQASDVSILAETPGWLKYRLPASVIRPNQKPKCIGQKQVWFLLRLESDESRVSLDHDHPEFDAYRWVDFWYPLEHVVRFKREVYMRALRHFSTPAATLAPHANILAHMPEYVTAMRKHQQHNKHRHPNPSQATSRA